MVVSSVLWSLLLLCCQLSSVQGSALHVPTAKRFHPSFLCAISPTAITIDDAQKSINKVLDAAKGLVWKKIQSFNPLSKFDTLSQQIFDSGAVQKDGTISFDECYSLVLKLYIQLNRDAPLPPPSRSSLQELYELRDLNLKKGIHRHEFTQLTRLIGRRAAARTLSHKISSIVLAPLLAQASLRQLRKVEQLPQIAARVIPKPLHPKLLPIVTSEQFGSTILVVFFVANLGDVVVKSVNFALSLVAALPNTNKES